MWILFWILFAVLLLCAFRQVVLMRAEQAAYEIIGVSPEYEVPAWEQIQNLKAAGILFRTEELEKKFILENSYNSYYASHPYYALLTDAGSHGILANVYGVFDRECIYDSEYGTILEGLAHISGLDITDIICPNRHQVSWKLNGKTYTWKGKRQRDWADPRIASALNRFCKGDKRFFTDNTHEGIIYLYGTKQLAVKLNTEFGLRFW